MKFSISKRDSNTEARTGLIQTDHGDIPTPVFMPVGTAGTVKAMHQKDLIEDVKADIILGNTYHLYLRPGLEILKNAGGLHEFMNWKRPILTDSGGYQVYSLSDRRKITDEGVNFSSHIDGSKHHFTPEGVMEIQRVIGADIVMAFDECTPYPCDFKYAEESMYLTHRWLKRCCAYMDKSEGHYGYEQELFPIVQGSVYKDLRKQSAETISSFDRFGNAIGGLSVGEPAELMYEMAAIVCEILPEEKPRYLMGVGTPVNLLENIALGIDMFDCVMPTRNARNGMLFTSEGIINIRNEKWKDDSSPLDENGTSFVDSYYSKAYLRHLTISKEMLAAQIATHHNLAFYSELMRQARMQIEAGTYKEWKSKMVVKLDKRL